MGIEMARKTANTLGARIGFLIAFELLLNIAISAEEAPRSIAPLPLSSACDVPEADIARPTSLANFATALKVRKTVRILAIGSSSTTGVGASSNGKTYPSQLEAILKLRSKASMSKSSIVAFLVRWRRLPLSACQAKSLATSQILSFGNSARMTRSPAWLPRNSKPRSARPFVGSRKSNRHCSRRDAIHATFRHRPELFRDPRQLTARCIDGERSLCSSL